MISRRYYNFAKLVPADEKHSTLFHLCELKLTGSNLVPERIARGAYLAFHNQSTLHLFWEKRTALNNVSLEAIILPVVAMHIVNP